MEDAAKDESPPKVVRRDAVGEDGQPNRGYLLMQNGGRSRYVENTFWASVDTEVIRICFYYVQRSPLN